jgi:hypothetical protein
MMERKRADAFTTDVTIPIWWEEKGAGSSL